MRPPPRRITRAVSSRSAGSPPVVPVPPADVNATHARPTLYESAVATAPLNHVRHEERRIAVLEARPRARRARRRRVRACARGTSLKGETFRARASGRAAQARFECMRALTWVWVDVRLVVVVVVEGPAVDHVVGRAHRRRRPLGLQPACRGVPRGALDESLLRDGHHHCAARRRLRVRHLVVAIGRGACTRDRQRVSARAVHARRAGRRWRGSPPDVAALRAAAAFEEPSRGRLT